MTDTLTLPHNDDAERATLNAMMFDAENAHLGVELLRIADFYSVHHQVIFGTMQSMLSSSTPIDLVTLIAALPITNGGARCRELLAEIATTSAAFGHLEHYAQIVRANAMRRQVVKQCHRLSGIAGDEKTSVDDLLASMQDDFNKTSRSFETGGFARHGSKVQDMLAELEKEHKPQGVMTGFLDLDNLTKGFQPGSLNIIAGLPSIGKSSLALNMAIHMAEVGPVAMSSLEDTHANIIRRLLSMKADLRFSPGDKLSKDEEVAFVNAATMIDDLPILVDDSADKTISAIHNRARVAKETEKIRLLIVDYIQLVQVPNAVDARDRVSRVSTGLKSIAKDLNIPIMALSQFSREGAKADRPRMHHLKESSQLEQDADTVLILSYDESETEDHSPELRTIACYLDKNRNGPQGQFGLQFKPSCFLFRSLASWENDRWLGNE